MFGKSDEATYSAFILSELSILQLDPFLRYFRLAGGDIRKTSQVSKTCEVYLIIFFQFALGIGVAAFWQR